MMEFKVKFARVKDFSYQATLCSQKTGVPHEAVYWFLPEIAGLDYACTPVKRVLTTILVGVDFI